MNNRKLYIFLTIVITLCSLSGCTSSRDKEDVALQPPDAAAVVAAIRESEDLFKQREGRGKLRNDPDYMIEYGTCLAEAKKMLACLS